MIDAAKNEREVTFTTFGRKTGKPYDVTIFVVTDGHRLYVIDPGETRMISELYGSKYGPGFGPPQPGEPPRLSEQATFELIPAGS
ncbi:MAG: hypothetical protein E6I88_13865 [Chloroflexi bacterium]|nr:MAG: hypothetical protein E6I88_13865 [Chloroflexota bacterium]